MQQRSSQSLVQYWDEIRAGRQAPQRCEIEPARIAALLPVTFILDCSPQSGYRFRLAGTRICEQLGRELRGVDLQDLFNAQDREPLEILLQEKNIQPDEAADRLDAFLIDADPDLFDDVVALAGRLRAADIACAFSYRRQGVSKQLREANQRGAAAAVIVGQETRERGVVTIKDLHSGTQTEQPMAALRKDPRATLPSPP